MFYVNLRPCAIDQFHLACLSPLESSTHHIFQVEHYVEKPETFVSNTINCGVYILGVGVLDHMKVQ